MQLSEQNLAYLSQSKLWLKLLSYEDGLLTNTLSTSINSKLFYLYQGEDFNPQKELISTLQAFKISPIEGDINQHAQCKFPARYIWLNQQLNFNELGIRGIECPEYKRWSKYDLLDSISFVFATGYLGNPASYYGHTLLKLNASLHTEERLLDVSINYGAEVPADEDPVSYILKGLVGGYDGSFSHSQFYFHTQNYLEHELRNIWEYKLNLSQQDQRFLLAHIWELIGQDYTYYFFNKNCVARMYQLFSLIEGIELPQMNPFWVVPQEAIRAINKAKYNNKNLIKEVVFIPSRQSQFYDKYWQLTSVENDYVLKIINNFDKLKNLPNANLSNEEKFRILAVLIDYYQFVIASNREELAHFKYYYEQVLNMRYQLPIGKAKFELSKPKSPHIGRPTSYTQVSWIDNELLGIGQRLKVRPTYYDQLDTSVGHIKNATLKMAELEFAYFNSALTINEFNLFSVVSVNNQATGLPKDNFDSWKLSLGFKNQVLRCQSCLGAIFEGSKGWAIPLSSQITTGFYVGGALTENYLNRGRVYLSSSTFLTAQITNHWNIKLDLKALKYIEKEKRNFTYYSVESRYQFNIGKYTLDARLGISKEDTHEFFAGLGYYW